MTPMPRIWALLGFQLPIYNKNEETFTSQGEDHLTWFLQEAVTCGQDISHSDSQTPRSSFPPTWLGSHSLQKHLFCQQNQDLGRLIFPGQWRATSLEVYIIFFCMPTKTTDSPVFEQLHFSMALRESFSSAAWCTRQGSQTQSWMERPSTTSTITPSCKSPNRFFNTPLCQQLLASQWDWDTYKP